MDETPEEKATREKREADAKKAEDERMAEAVKRAAEAATARSTAIMDLCVLAGRSLSEAQKLIAGTKTVDEIRAEFVNAKAAGSETELRGQQPGGAPAGGSADVKPGALRERMAATLQQRGIKPAGVNLHQGA